MRTIQKTICIMLVLTMLSCALCVSSLAASPYYIEVDCFTNIATVFSTADNSIVRQMICSTGTKKWKTIQGTFQMPKMVKPEERTDWYQFEDGIGKYGSRIKGNFLFHSYLFHSRDNSDVDWETYAAMGTSASHGCVRLYVDDAKWIAEHCFAGTTVKLYTGKTRYDYLKELLYAHTYSIDDCSYAEFVCMAQQPGELGYNSKGDDVTSLQNRMIELGLYPGTADGFYGEEMVRSVKAIQSALGRKVTGVADQSLIELLEKDDAPSSTISTLQKGMSGPAVTELQRILSAFGLYDTSVTGEYDDATEEAVKLYQSLCGLTPDGIASASLRQSFSAGFDKLEAKFGAGGYALIYEEQAAETAVISSKKRMNVRSRKSTDSASLGKLDPGTQVDVLDHGGNWSKIQTENGTVGYVQNTYLKFSQTTKSVPTYVEASAQNRALPDRPETGENVIGARNVTYGVVNTDDERLWVRQSPDTGADLIFMLSPGTPLRVLSTGENWAYVTYGGKSGYAQSKYLKMTQTAELTGEFVRVAEDETAQTELPDDTVYAMTQGETALYSIASEAGETVGTMAAFDRAEILLKGENWTQVRFGSIVGYAETDALLIGTTDDLNEVEASLRKAQEVKCVVSTGSEATLNFRSAPSSDAELISKLDNGTVLTVVEEGNEWTQVRYGQTVGYVMTQFIRPLDSTGAPYEPEGYEPEEADDEEAVFEEDAETVDPFDVEFPDETDGGEDFFEDIDMDDSPEPVS